METEKFLISFYRFVALFTPIVMLLKSMWDKDFKGLAFETVFLVLYLLLLAFILGFKKALSLNNGKKERQKSKN